MHKHGVEFTKVSTKGQIVIPRDIREEMGIKSGSVFSVLHPKNDMIVLKMIDDKVGKIDVKTMKMIEKAWKEIESGKAHVYSKAEFLKHMESW